jgi:hypothetical protein
MKDAAILDELLALLEQNNVTVRMEAMGGGGGGLCKIKDKKVFFVDTEASAADMAASCAQAVNEIVDIEKVYIRPQVRDFVEKNR